MGKEEIKTIQLWMKASCLQDKEKLQKHGFVRKGGTPPLVSLGHRRINRNCREGGCLSGQQLEQMKLLWWQCG